MLLQRLGCVVANDAASPLGGDQSCVEGAAKISAGGSRRDVGFLPVVRAVGPVDVRISVNSILRRNERVSLDGKQALVEAES